jgi:hypothetical protein
LKTRKRRFERSRCRREDIKFGIREMEKQDADWFDRRQWRAVVCTVTNIWASQKREIAGSSGSVMALCGRSRRAVISRKLRHLVTGLNGADEKKCVLSFVDMSD